MMLCCVAMGFNNQACKGAHTSKCKTPSKHMVVRQSVTAINHAMSGMNTVLAKPPKKVSKMMARRKSLGKRLVNTANAGGYKVAESPMPKPNQAK